MQTVRNKFQSFFQLLRGANQVEMECGHRKIRGGAEILSESFEIRSDKNPQGARNLRELFIRNAKCPKCFGASVEREHRFVELNPIGSRVDELAKNFFVDRKNALEEQQGFEASLLGLAEQ